ncbi:GNAT family N-acetyltransferase [Knoellia sp. S7-12]|uniref:GNAT family N-acetyltransferase n=1 Tax=Knoellia sp. S7-12 TaxID=3126698 RepID=UPI0033668801
MTEPTFPDIVLQSLTRHGVLPSRGYVTLGHYDALICHYPPEPDRAFVVHWTRSERDPAELFGELTAYLRDAGARSAEWWFRDDSTPHGLEEIVLAAGAETVEDQACVARAVNKGLPEIAPGVRVTLVEDSTSLDAMVDIGVEVFESPEPPDRAELLTEVLDELHRATGAWVVGWLDGEPVGRARVGFESNVAPLVGAAVLPHARRRGVYAAMLAARLDLASTVGCHTAVTKARRTQSLPILLREGFTVIGHERAHLLDIGP